MAVAHTETKDIDEQTSVWQNYYQIEGVEQVRDADGGVQDLALHLSRSLREHELLLDREQEGGSELTCSHYGDLLATYFLSFKVNSVIQTISYILLKLFPRHFYAFFALSAEHRPATL